MKEKLPIWFQALALILLSSIFVVTLSWVWQQDRDLSGRVHNLASDSIWIMAISIIFLGARFFWRYPGQDHRGLGSAIISWLALFVMLAAFLALLFLPRAQINRQAHIATAYKLANALREPGRWS